MRKDADLHEYSTTSNLQGEGSTRPDAIDPDLLAIRSVIHPVNTRQAVGKPAAEQTEKGTTKKDRHDQSSKGSCRQTPLASGIRRSAASIIRRPDAPRLLACLCLLAFALLKPGFVTFLFVMGILTLLVLFFSFGPDRTETWVVNRYERLRDRDPDAAEHLRLRAARVSKTLTALIEKLPERWTTGFYLPDFEEPGELPEKLKTDPFERLSRQ